MYYTNEEIKQIRQRAYIKGKLDAMETLACILCISFVFVIMLLKLFIDF